MRHVRSKRLKEAVGHACSSTALSVSVSAYFFFVFKGLYDTAYVSTYETHALKRQWDTPAAAPPPQSVSVSAYFFFCKGLYDTCA